MTALETAHTLHEQAMDLAEAAYLSSLRGQAAAALDLYRKAFALDRDAATALLPDFEAEPTRSILFRSAATLGIRCGDLRAAERLASQGLAGEPPEEIAEELRAVLDNANFERHLRVSGIRLDPNSFQMSDWGNAIGDGGRVAGPEFSARYQSTERLLLRTAERQLHRDFREEVSTAKGFRENFSVYLSPPRTASFAITVSIGVREQMLLPGTERLTPVAGVVEDFIACMAMFNDGKDAALKERIGDPAYYANFVGLAKRIAPDGDRIKGVGFTAVIRGQERGVGVTRVRSDAPSIVEHAPERVSKKRGGDEGEPVYIKGRLALADSRRKSKDQKIILEDREGVEYALIVPPGMMRDIVKPLWEQEVAVRGWQKGKRILLEDVQEAEIEG